MIADDEMVEEVDVNILTEAPQLLAGPEFPGSRPRAAWRVIMGKDEPGRAEPTGLADDGRRFDDRLGAAEPLDSQQLAVPSDIKRQERWSAVSRKDANLRRRSGGADQRPAIAAQP